MADENRGRAGGMQHGEPFQGVAVPNTNSDSASTYDSDSGASSTDVGYFAFHGITAGPKDDFNSMFNRLAIKEGWTKTQRKKRCYEAIAGEIEGIYGTDNTKLEKWQELCRDVKIVPVPLSITKCKKVSGHFDVTNRVLTHSWALSAVYVNLVNLISHRHNPNVEVMLFPNYHEFRKWTLGGKKGSRIFPKKLAKKEGFIKALLKDLHPH